MFKSLSLRQFFLLLFLIPILVVARAANKDTIPNLVVDDGAIHFLVIGDWGQKGSPAQTSVAAAMGDAGRQLGISFVITTGDNFYHAGVASVSDSHWVYSFDRVYDDRSLQCRWLPVLGNHDYSGNPQAQVDYTFTGGGRWFMPGRYYDTSLWTGSDSALFVFLDTEPIERQLRGLLPDTSKYPADYADTQLQWLRQLLSSSSAKWKIVTGHHPLHTGGSRRHNRRVRKLRRLLQPIFHAHNVNLYLSGHEHHLEFLKPEGPTHYAISGAGSDTRYVGWLKFHRRFAARKNGFAAVSISDKGWMIQFISDAKKVLYKYENQ